MLDNIQSRAQRMYDERRRRTAFFPQALLSDHAWDIMLWIFIETGHGRYVTAAEAAAAAMVGYEVGSRWINALTQAGLVVIREPPADEQSHVFLSDDGLHSIQAYLQSQA